MKCGPEFFRIDEFRCPCCGTGRPAALLVLWLEGLRRAWGGPVVVNSGFRCGRHNAEVGGVSNSRHLIGCAADVRPAEGSMEDFSCLGQPAGLGAAFLREIRSGRGPAAGGRGAVVGWGGGGGVLRRRGQPPATAFE